ncbi:hypothetical protein [Musicola keenii]|uniref:hypothetical protein n=1 Tax=Musicola keenii TaxID=2884250 RepID=UPI00177D1D24|nr:hypothetical protein [Musicola keenii]
MENMEVVILIERIALIARLGELQDMGIREHEIALMWIRDMVADFADRGCYAVGHQGDKSGFHN